MQFYMIRYLKSRLLLILLNIVKTNQHFVELYNPYNHLINLSFTIISKCSYNEMLPVLLMGNWSDPNLKNYLQNYSKDLIILGVDDYDNVKYSKPIERIYKLTDKTPKPYPVEIFVIMEYNFESLKIVLNKLKYSRWWNLSALFFIQHILSDDQCTEVYKYIKLIWKFNILSVIYLCRQKEGSASLYTFNPYSRRAPKIWKIHGVYRQDNGHELIVFHQSFNFTEFTIDSGTVCKSLNYDKTTELDEYPIRICGLEIIINNEYDKKTKKFKGYVGTLVSTLYEILKMNLSQHVVNEFGYIDQEGKPDKILQQVFNGEYDMHLNYFYQRGLGKNEMNVFGLSGICYVTRKIHMTIGEQFMLIFPCSVWIPMIILYVLIVLLFVKLMKINLSKASMEILRVIIGNSTLRHPDDISKMIFIYIVIFFMILATFLQSVLNSMLLSTVHFKQMNTIEELIANDYKIYSAKLYKQYFTPPFTEKIRSVKHVTNCLAMLEHNSKIACINDCTGLKYYVSESNNIHISTDPARKTYYAFLFRDDYSLQMKVRGVYHRLFENGFTEHIRSILHYMYKRKTDDTYYEAGITIDQMKFSLYFIAIGYSFGIFLLFFEQLYVTFIGKNMCLCNSLMSNARQDCLTRTFEKKKNNERVNVWED